MASVTTIFASTPSPDPTDRIVVEVGDSKQEEFLPQVKVMRWDNEVNVSIRLVDETPAVPILDEQPDKVTWTKGDLKADFYDVAPNGEHPKGAFEFDITLASKPVTNVLVFSLMSKGVEFLYQPLLANVNKDGSSWIPSPKGVGQIQRAAGVGGGYAIYHAAPPNNVEGGKQYRSGKVGMLFRPKMVDAVGTVAWGDLLIAGDVLTVTIPQKFLDTAVYPVRHAAGLTFGYTTVGGSNDCDFGTGNAYYLQLESLSPAGSNTDTNHSVCVSEDACGFGAQTLRMALYTDSGNLPNAKQVEDGSNTTGPLVNAFVTGPAVSFALAASTQYWIGYTGVTGGGAGVMWDTGGSKRIAYEGSAGLPATAGASEIVASAHPSAYVTYTAAGGASVTPNVGSAILTGLAPSRVIGTILTPVTP